MKKLSLNVDALSVETFEAGHRDEAPGTVEARQECTAGNTCKCRTSLYACGTLPATAYSCPPTIRECF